MKKLVLLLLLVVLLTGLASCARRMAPFSPHRSTTDAHLAAVTNQACLECHPHAELGPSHQTGDDCLRCHRILQGD